MLSTTSVIGAPIATLGQQCCDIDDTASTPESMYYFQKSTKPILQLINFYLKNTKLVEQAC